MHEATHPLAGQTVKIKTEGIHAEVAGELYVIEDWWDHLTGGSWQMAQGNPAALKYAIRSGLQDFRTPLDDEVVYGKIGALGHLIHVSEFEVAS